MSTEERGYWERWSDRRISRRIYRLFRRRDCREPFENVLLLAGEGIAETVGFVGFFTALGRHLAQGTQSFVDHQLAAFRKGLQFLIGLPQLLALRGCEAFEELPAPQGAFALLGRQIVEPAQIVLEFGLALGRQLLEARIIFQGLFLLVGREIAVGPDPSAGPVALARWMVPRRLRLRGVRA